MTTKTALAKKIAIASRKNTMLNTNEKKTLTPGEATTLLAQALSKLPETTPAARAVKEAGVALDDKETATAAPAAAPAAATPAAQPEPQAAPLHRWLAEILSTRRCHDSQGDYAFRSWLVDTFKKLGVKHTMLEGNYVVEVKNKGKGKDKPKILFSCHIDTCHSHSESNGQRQALSYDKGLEHLFLTKKDKEDKPLPNVPGCLGADDGGGIYIMLRMIEAKVPGTYVFHTGEEKGCIGSRAIANKQSGWLKSFTHAIAFDRQGTEDIIVTQGGQVCASIECGESLAKALNGADTGLEMSISHRGVLTDVKHYAYDIPECINLAIGYDSQHTSNESLNVAHIESLVAACLKIDWASLPVKRQCAPRFQDSYGGGYGRSSYGSGSYGDRSGYEGRGQSGFSNDSLFDEEEVAAALHAGRAASNVKPIKAVEPPVETHPVDWLLKASRTDITAWMEEDGDGMVNAVLMLIARHKGAVAQMSALEDFI